MKVHVCATSGRFKGYDTEMSSYDIVRYVKYCEHDCILSYHKGTPSKPEAQPYLVLEEYDDYRE